ncbi:GDSL esterase/lipase [Hordeum vulgare]|nr:GDSL esterase/lipase [Hordeum vulgare]
MAGHGGPLALVALCVLELALRGAGAAGEAPAPGPALGLAPGPAPERLVPAMFVFGDSTVDVGNNNLLPDCTPACRANYPQYGVDYPSQEPTGRFSNGFNLADQLGAVKIFFPLQFWHLNYVLALFLSKMTYLLEHLQQPRYL